MRNARSAVIRSHGTRAAVMTVAAALVALTGTTALADSRTQARRIHDRIAGVPPSAAVLDQMSTEVAAGRPENAAYVAMENRAFYDVTLKNFAMPWTNREQTVFAPLNDYVATVIGMVRDDVPFDRVLWDDIIYVGQGVPGVPAYSPNSNDHYASLERQGASLKDVLVQTTQSSVSGLPPQATSGVITSRAAAQSFFVAGTNRAMFRFTLINHLCTDLEQVMDTTRPPDRVRQDVSRSPGGDSRIFLNNCVGCHSGMDPMVQAYAYHDWDEQAGRIVYSPGVVRPKYFHNKDTFPAGYSTPDDHWDNYWRNGRNSLIGWDAAMPGSGSGAKSLGAELAHSDAFASCQAKKVFRAVCLRDPADGQDRSRVQSMSATFKTNGYRVKQLFADAAAYCMGD